MMLNVWDSKGDKRRWQGAAPPRSVWRGILAHLSAPERAKRQLDRVYQRRAGDRLRESGLARG